MSSDELSAVSPEPGPDMPPHVVLYHGSCYDGFGAAYAAWKALGDRAIYQAVFYGAPPPKLEKPSVIYLLDFCYSPDELISLLKEGHQIEILDHHVTAMDAFSKYADSRVWHVDFVLSRPIVNNERLYSLTLSPKGHAGWGSLLATFDMDRSGATVTWDHFHPGEDRPELLEYVQDRDLWTLKLPESREVHCALQAYPFDFEVWDRVDVAELRNIGGEIMRYQDRMVEEICTKVQIHTNFKGSGETAAIVNATNFWSEVGDYLLKKYPKCKIAASWFINTHGQRQWSLRARKDEFSVGELASKFGGGGHQAAAGFEEAFDFEDLTRWERFGMGSGI